MSHTDKRYFEPSPYASDGDFYVGKDPRRISIDVLRGLGLPESYPKAIRAKCLDCSGGNDAEVRKCVCTNCPLWPLRMGVNPFHRKAKSR